MQFKNIIGHEAVKARLIQSVMDNRISHAQLFSGKPGNGCLALAMAYCQFINCENRNHDDSCGVCSSCIKMEKMIHPDVHFSFPVAGPNKPKSVDFIVQWRESFLENPWMELQEWVERLKIENKQGFISVDEAGDLVRKLSLKPFESEYKTVIMWLPEKMKIEASNTLLKIIEEPPDKTLFLLVTENAELIIATILSRTQLIKMGKISDSEIKRALIQQLQLSEEEAIRITRFCDGNLNRALQLGDKENAVLQDEKGFIDWMRMCYSPMEHFPALLDKMDRFARLSREEQKNYLSFALTVLRECLLMNLNVADLLRFGEKGYEQLLKFSALIHVESAPLLEEAINKAYFHTERNANAKILFIDLSFKINKILKIKKPEPVLQDVMRS